MVLQAGLAAPVWGSAEAGAEVRVRIAGQSKSARAGADGRWSLKLDPIPAGGPHELVVEGEPAVVVRDVLVGEVWICSGQSNMEWNVNSSRDAETEKAAAQYPTIRLFTVPRRSSGEPQNDVVGAWKPCSPETVGSFSAVAYFFGRELARELQVPVGLIHSSWGGTAAELWTRREALEKDEALRPLVDGYADRVKRWEEATAKHKESVEKARAAGKQPPRAPGKPMAPSSLYNGMISPLVPYGIRGAIWYQGEANAGRAKQYETLFPALIRNWRQDWGQGEFPFGFVQLANFMKREEQPGESDWAELRDAQLKTLALPNTGMAVTIDVGDAADIHPKNKQEVGKRLALWAQAKVYRRDRVYSGPIFESSKVEGSKIRLGFKHAGSGLAASGGGRLRGFAVAGEDRRWVWADAVIEGTEVVVSSPSVPQPAAVRYGWANNPDCTLVNREGLPASPFRTDAWPRMK
jgi:sialate O-acetylesterase